MNQYEFQMTSETAYYKRATMRCTARDAQTALAAVVAYYGREYTVQPEPIAVRPAHEVMGEIDATNAD